MMKMELELRHLQFKHPATILVVGMTGSGKTILIRRIIKNSSLLFSNLPAGPRKIMWAYGQWHPLLNVHIDDNIIVNYVEGLPTEEQILQYKPDILVIDDLMNELNKNKSFENLFTKKSHHLNMSVIFSVQNLFYNSPIMRTISLNSQYMILMKNPRDKTQVINLARQVYPHNIKYFVEAYNDATNEAYGYIKVDLTPDTPESFRLQSRITPEEVAHLNKRFAPIIYKPKHVS